MTGTTQTENDVQKQPDSGSEQLKQQIGSLETIIAELLLKNQKLRWELFARGISQGPSVAAIAGEMPFRKNSWAAGIP
jgi:hypothetical protein